MTSPRLQTVQVSAAERPFIVGLPQQHGRRMLPRVLQPTLECMVLFNGPSILLSVLMAILMAIMMGWAHASWALSIVVTPGSSASYLYFPPLQSSSTGTSGTGAGSGATVPVAGVGGVSLTKSGAFTAYTLTHAPSASSCGVSCTLGQFNTGAGFVTLTSSRPSTFTDTLDVPLSNCTATLNCTTWVNANANLSLRVYPNCFEGDYKILYANTCTLTTTPAGINAFYAINLSAVGVYAGTINASVLVYNLMPTLAAWESVSDFYSNKFGVAASTPSGAQNKLAIQATYTPNSIEDTCTALGPQWVVPSSNELQLFVASLPLKYYWTSNDVNQNNAMAISSTGQNSVLLKWTPLGMTCVRYYPLG